MNWQIKLHCNDDQVAVLEEYLGATGWAPRKLGDTWYLERLAQALATSNGEKLRLEAQRILDIARLTALITGKRFPDVGVGPASYLDPEGRRHHVVFSTLAVEVEIGVQVRGTDALGESTVDFRVSSETDDETAVDPVSTEELTALLIAHPRIAEAADLFAKYANNWSQLCKILEIVRHDIGGNIPGSWASKDTVTWIERTAQFEASAGETSRHVKANGEPPATPMPIKRAQKVIRRILVEWAKSKA